MISIKIKCLTGKTLSIDIDPSNTVADLMQKFCEIEGVPIDQQRLIFAGKQLEHEKKLSECGIGEDSTIHQVLRLRGGGGFEFASMEKLKKVKLAESAPDYRTIRGNGMFLIGKCTNDRCEIHTDEFLVNIGMGTFNAEHLNSKCICPKCHLQSNHTDVGFFECGFHVKGFTIDNQVKKFYKQVDGCQMECIDSGAKWLELEIKVQAKAERVTFAVKLDSDN